MFCGFTITLAVFVNVLIYQLNRCENEYRAFLEEAERVLEEALRILDNKQ